MFAKYTIHSKSKFEKFLGLSALYLEISIGKTKRKIELGDLSKSIIEKRRKLAPLITGGIITSLSLLSFVLYSSSFEVIALIGLGLLLTYFGTTEYTVIRLEYASTNELIWLPLTVKLESVRPFVALLEFYLTKKQFPIIYGSPVVPEDNSLIHYENSPVKSSGTIIYQFGKSSSISIPQVAVNPALLDHTLEFAGQGKVIAEGSFLINSTAVIDTNSIIHS